MTLLTHILDQTATVVTTTTNGYGDQVETSSVDIPCRFRYITNVDHNINAEAINSEAMVWFEPDADVAEAAILLIDGAYWRVDKLIKARRFSSTIVFLKAFVSKHQLAS